MRSVPGAVKPSAAHAGLADCARRACGLPSICVLVLFVNNPHPAPKPTDAEAPPAEDARYIVRVLFGLLGLASKLAGLVQRRALAQPEALVSGSVAFERVARCIRRLVALMQRMTAVPQPAAALRRAARAADEAEEYERPERLERLERLEGLDEWDELEDPESIEADELEEDEFAADIGQPAAAIIADVCRELGLGDEWRSHPWERCTPEDLAALCASLCAYAARPTAARQDALPWAPPPLCCTGRSPPASLAAARPEPPS